MIITWSDSLLRYPEFAKLPDVSSSAQTLYINMAEAMVHSRLATFYTTPFSSNNLTAADLAIDAIFIATQLTRQPEKTKALKEWWEERIAALISGDSQMVTSAGEIAGTLTGEPVWSSTQDYHPTFGMGDIIGAQVDSSQLIDEDEARGHLPGEAL